MTWPPFEKRVGVLGPRPLASEALLGSLTARFEDAGKAIEAMGLRADYLRSEFIKLARSTGWKMCGSCGRFTKAIGHHRCRQCRRLAWRRKEAR